MVISIKFNNVLIFMAHCLTKGKIVAFFWRISGFRLEINWGLK